MCEYSLAYFPNRLAVEGERLVLQRFPCGTLGMASARRSLKTWLFPSTTCAVCIAPGARLLLEGIPEDLRRRFAIGPAEEVTFTQQSAEAFTYRDALRFATGREVLLQRLPVGLRVRVLSVQLAETEEPRTRPVRIAATVALVETQFRDSCPSRSLASSPGGLPR